MTKNAPSCSLELTVFIADAVSTHALPSSGRVTIGRSAENDVPIDHASVSRKHAVLHIDTPLRLEDLGSANGTCVQPRDDTGSAKTVDMRLRSGQTVQIKPGDCINLGSAIIVVRRAPIDLGDAVIREPAMQALYALADRAAQAAISVLLLGETGVGKEVLAEYIHRRSPRAARPFVPLHCAALPEPLLESELFGHEKGAFSGAGAAKPGLFESAEGGTVLLDEIGELPALIQVKLLRVIEERKVRRVGAVAPRPIDVRFIAATNRDLEADVARGTFRQDLFFRLNGMTLTIPPLRERTAEIEALAALFAARAEKQSGAARSLSVSTEALEYLRAYAWPGNVRELRNVIDRATVLCVGSTILAEHLPMKMITGHSVDSAPAPVSGVDIRAPSSRPRGESATPQTLRSELSALERQRILDALERCGGNQTQVAELLGMSRRTLVSRLGEYGISRPRKKPG